MVSLVDAKSVNLIVGFFDTDTSLHVPTVIAQRRGHTNQIYAPQSYPGGTQLTAAKKVSLPNPLQLLEFPPVTSAERDELVAAARKECGEWLAQKTAEARLPGELRSPTVPSLELVHDFLNEKGRWIRSVLLRLSPQSGKALAARLVPPKEVAGFILVTAVAPEKIGVFTREDKTPVQEGGTAIPEGVIRMFADDREALLKAARLLAQRAE